ncbi:MAG: hypothetical protein PHW40_07265 [Candidatus Izemoplasmatales bacterium]|nr:hypothetical protein [Candidatus Izemoplasmatales bacterium]
MRRIFATTRAQIIIRWEQRDKMRSRTIEIIDNHIEALEEELEWYQKKNIEWQEKYEKLEKQKLFEPYPNIMMFLGRPIDYWQTLQHYADINSVEKLINENTKLKQAAANHHNNWMTSQQENARLREQLRWHPVSELPRKTKSIPQWSVNVVFKRSILAESVAYYNFKSNRWISLYSHNPIIVESGDKWCYIPDDNQGTDCTPEGGDA